MSGAVGFADEARVLSGLRVVEIGQMIAGPYAGAIFADLGAEVIKIERPGGGDDARRMGQPFLGDDSLVFQVFNRGKMSKVLDLEQEGDLDAFHALISDCDILVNNLRPGVSERFGIDSDRLCERHPRLIYCHIAAFGHDGPLRMDPGFEPLVQAFSGVSSANGGPDDPPMRVGASILDQGTGMWAAIGALAMLSERSRTGRGGVVKLSLLETAMAWNSMKADPWLNEGKLPPKHRSGHPGLAPYEMFEAADLPIVICCGNDRQFAKLAACVGKPEWCADPRYESNRQRLSHKDTLLPALQAVLATATRAEWLHRLKDAGVPCTELHTIPEAIEHPQVRALDLIQTVGTQQLRLTALPMRLHGHRPVLRDIAPQLGAHTDTVWTERG